MYAFKGDRIRMHDEHLHTTRDAVVISSDYIDGRPPFWVRWTDTGEADVIYPSTGADIVHDGPAYPLEDEPRLVVAALAAAS